MASATVYGRRPKFFMAEHSATAEGENCTYGPTLLSLEQFFLTVGQNNFGNKIPFFSFFAMISRGIEPKWGQFGRKACARHLKSKNKIG